MPQIDSILLLSIFMVEEMFEIFEIWSSEMSQIDSILPLPNPHYTSPWFWYSEKLYGLNFNIFIFHILQQGNEENPPLTC